MLVFIGKRNDNTSFGFLQKAYLYQYGQLITQKDIYRTDKGKPFFICKGMPYFSLSHSGDYLACAFDENDKIGLDIQKIKRIPDILISNYLSVQKGNPLDAIIEWTRFESYGKMTGTGIPPADDYSQGIFFTTLELIGYVITVCFEKIEAQEIELKVI